MMQQGQCTAGKEYCCNSCISFQVTTSSNSKLSNFSVYGKIYTFTNTLFDFGNNPDLHSKASSEIQAMYWWRE